MGMNEIHLDAELLRTIRKKRRTDLVERFVGSKAALVGGGIVLFFVVMAVFGSGLPSS